MRRLQIRSPPRGITAAPPPLTDRLLVRARAFGGSVPLKGKEQKGKICRCTQQEEQQKQRVGGSMQTNGSITLISTRLGNYFSLLIFILHCKSPPPFAHSPASSTLASMKLMTVFLIVFICFAAIHRSVGLPAIFKVPPPGLSSTASRGDSTQQEAEVGGSNPSRTRLKPCITHL